MMQSILQSITTQILSLFRQDANFKNALPLHDYHGFQKARIPSATLAAIAAAHNVNPDDLQAEWVVVTQDLSGEIHRHLRSRAYCIVMGAAEHVPDPARAFVFLHDAWTPVAAGQTIDIPPAAAHGFTIRPGGTLHFLSVQIPPIESAAGDDYEKVLI
ncbi:MAG: hypothetical protein NT003_00685 [Candidatus Magasanikbacteria bacterium]|nr:hypothetical protein [Candidatus Magasanikbacteria bacterium]